MVLIRRRQAGTPHESGHPTQPGTRRLICSLSARGCSPAWPRQPHTRVCRAGPAPLQRGRPGAARGHGLQMPRSTLDIWTSRSLTSGQLPKCRASPSQQRPPRRARKLQVPECNAPGPSTWASGTHAPSPLGQCPARAVPVSLPGSRRSGHPLPPRLDYARGNAQARRDQRYFRTARRFRRKSRPRAGLGTTYPFGLWSIAVCDSLGSTTGHSVLPEAALEPL